jgi:Type II secretion system (T2SS), protein E, N-terminal domain
VEAALFTAQSRGISLAQAVNDLHPELLELLERALDRADFPAIHRVRPLRDLTASLPVGLCERLLAVPVHREARGERIDIAAVDVLDSHVASELSFHLGAPVRVLRASFAALTAALHDLEHAGVVLSELKLEPEWEEAEEDPETEPVLSLIRPKPFLSSAPEAAGPPWAVELETAMAGLERAESPEEVVQGLCEGLRPVRALVFAVRNTSFDVRGGSASLGSPAMLRELRVPSGNGSLLDATARLGLYFGPLAQLGALNELEGKWAVGPGSDCYARSVNVSARPSLILLMAGFSESTEATRRADVLTKCAGGALERIVRARKKA